MTEGITVRPFTAEDLAACERILRSLPEWFGMEESNQQYIRDFSAEETWVACIDDRVVGVMTLKTHTPSAAEVSFLAVDRDLHRRSIGRRLVEHAAHLLAGRGTALLQVKTRGPSAPDANYEKTRRFYEAEGFLALEEIPTLWDAENPALIMVRVLTPAASDR